MTSRTPSAAGRNVAWLLEICFGSPTTCARPIVQPPASTSSLSESCSRCRRHGGVAADADSVAAIYIIRWSSSIKTLRPRISFFRDAKVVSCEGLGRSRHRAPLSPSEKAVASARATPAATLRPWSRCVGEGQRFVCFVCVGERDVAASVDLHNNECSSCLVLLKISTFSDGSKQQTLSARLARTWRCAPHSRSPVSLIVLPRSCSCRWGPCPSPTPRLVCLFSFFSFA